MSPNHGGQPGCTAGRRVHVVLRSGYDTREREPAGWAADGGGACRWTLTDHPFDIMQWEPVQ